MSITLRRIGLIGDVHGEDAALEATLQFLVTQGPLDGLLCTGDLPAKSGIGDTDRCCQLLSDARVKTIRGNHDRWALENAAGSQLFGLGDVWPVKTEALDFLRSLPPTRTFETPVGSLLQCHGVDRDDMAGIYPGGEDEPILQTLKAKQIHGWHRVMICGHTHQRMVRRIGTVTILNPGTLRWEENPGFAIVDFEEGTAQFFNLTPFTNEITPGEEIALW